MLVRKLLRPVPKRLPHAIEIEAYLSLALFGFTLVACAQRDRNLHSLCTNDGLEDLVPHRNGERCASSFAQDILRNTLSELNEGGTGTPHWGSHLICTVYHPCVAVGERITQKYQKDERNQYVLNGMVPRRGDKQLRIFNLLRHRGTNSYPLKRLCFLHRVSHSSGTVRQFWHGAPCRRT